MADQQKFLPGAYEVYARRECTVKFFKASF